MSCDYTFDELEEFAARINNMSSDERGAARAARRRLSASHDDRLRN